MHSGTWDAPFREYINVRQATREQAGSGTRILTNHKRAVGYEEAAEPGPYVS